MTVMKDQKKRTKHVVLGKRIIPYSASRGSTHQVLVVCKLLIASCPTEGYLL